MTDKHQIADDLTTLAYPIEKLKHLDGNPRKGNVEAVKKSYEKFGQRKPIVATKDGEVISGNHQLAAARELGWNKIAVVFTDDDELTAKAFALADNRTADLGTYDDDLLADMLGAVSSDLEMLEATSFTEDDLYKLIGFDEVQEKELPKLPQTPKTKVGDTYKLGNHTLVCGDATDEELIKKIIKNKTDMVFTDPPYNMDFTGSFHADGTQSFNSKYKKIENDNLSNVDSELFINSFLNIIKKYNKGAFYITYYRLGIGKLWELLNKNNLLVRALIIWSKGNHTLSNSDYMSMYEPIFYGWSEEHNFYGGKNGKDIWDIKRTNLNNLHPTMKPVPLIEKAITDSSKVGNTVLDLFAGSGSTLIACENTKRKNISFELEPEYCDIIIERWENLTGQKAELIDEIKEVD